MILTISSLGYMFTAMMTTPLITGYAASIGAGGVLMGMISSINFICAMVCRPFIGNLLDVKSKHLLSSIGALIITCTSIGYVLSKNTLTLFIMRLINGVGYSCCTVCATTWASSLLPAENVKSGMGLFGTANAVSMAIAPAIGVTVTEKYGHRAAFVLGAVFSFFCFIGFQLVSDKGLPMNEVRRQRKINIFYAPAVPMAVYTMIFTIPYYALQSFLVTYIKEKGIDIPASLYFPIYAAFLLILRVGLKRLFDTVDYGWFILFGSVSAALCMICLWQMDNMLIMVLSGLFMAGGYGIVSTVSQGNAIARADSGSKGIANSTYYLGLDLGMALGPFLGGIVYANFDIDNFFLYFLFAPILCLLILALRHYRN